MGAAFHINHCRLGCAGKGMPRTVSVLFGQFILRILGYVNFSRSLHRRVGHIQGLLQLGDAGEVDFLLFALVQFPVKVEDMVKLCPHIVCVVLRHLLRQGGDQVLDGTDMADIPAGRAWVGLDIAALAVMAVMAVQQVFRVRTDLVIIAAVRVGKDALRVALRRVPVAAVVALGGGGVAAVLGMRRVMVTKPGVRLTLHRERPGGAKAQAQGQSGDDTQNSALHVASSSFTSGCNF